MKRILELYEDGKHFRSEIDSYLFDEIKCAQKALELQAKTRPVELGIEFTFAFQPIVNVALSEVWGYEALIRGPNNEPAEFVLKQLNDENRSQFDHVCRYEAIKLASHLQLDKFLSINIMPNALYNEEHCISTTLLAAEKFGFPRELLMFEVIESEEVKDRILLSNIFQHYKPHGFRVALDDFGAGHAGLNMLLGVLPDVIKLDQYLVHGIESNFSKQIVVETMISMCQRLGVEILAEGVETAEEYRFLRGLGISMFQGFYFAKASFKELPLVHFPQESLAS